MMRGWLMGAVVLLIGSAACAETVHSLDRVPGALKTENGKAVFAEQMQGAPAPDRLGLNLPPGMSAAAVAALLRPQGDMAPLNAVGVRPLPGEADLYVAVVCTGGDIPKSLADTACSAYSGDAAVASLKVYTALLRMPPNTPPTLAARPVAVDGMTDWSKADLPDAPGALSEASGDSIAPMAFSGFDLAPYVIAPGVRAFGLRGTWTDGYSGGMAEFGALYLFAAEDGTLRQVLTVPLTEYRDIAGDWHKNGTRDHDITDLTNLVIVTKTITNGHFDLRLKRRGGKDVALYRWSDGRYRRADM